MRGMKGGGKGVEKERVGGDSVWGMRRMRRWRKRRRTKKGEGGKGGGGGR